VVRQTYTRTLKKLIVDQRFRNLPKNKSNARKADKKVKTIAGRLLNELERNLRLSSLYFWRRQRNPKGDEMAPRLVIG